MDFELLSRELHRAAQKPRVRRPAIVHGVDDTWALDTAFFTEWANENGGYKYALCVVDVFSRFAWLRPLRTKNPTEVWDALQSIMTESGRKPRLIWSDEGGEFKNKLWAARLKKAGIKLYHTHGEHKSAYVERWTRTIKAQIWKRFTATQTRQWVPIIQGLVDAYNKRVHSSIRMSPTEASKKEREAALWLYQYGDVADAPLVPTKFKVGDWVRISRIKNPLVERGYHPSWSLQKFQVNSVDAHAPPTYKLTEFFTGEQLHGSFYDSEMQKTSGDIPAIEKIVKRRTVKGRKQVLVQWLGYGPNQLDWLDAADVTDVA